MAKKTAFYFILLLLVVLSIEMGAKAFYFVKRGKFSHLLSLEKAGKIRKILPYEPDKNKVSAVERGDFLVKNGYYTYNPKSRVVKGTYIRINNLGFRGQDVPTDDKAVRILCLGGSTTFGYYAKRSYPELLDDLLNRTGREYRVINGGINAVNIQHICNMLRDEDFVKKIKPNILIINTVWNTVEQYENNLLVESIDNKIIRNILNNSVLAFFIYKGILFLKYGEYTGPFQALCVYIDKICRWASDRGVKVILVNEPMVLTEKAWGAAPENPKNHARASGIFERFEEKYKGTVTFTVINFFEKMNFNDEGNIKKYFVDKGHLTEAGYIKEAEELSKTVHGITERK